MTSPTALGPQRLGYVASLDGVRGLAVLLVIGFHAFDWPRNGGDLGVGLFFVLSGFLITTLLLEEVAETGTIRLRRFYARRSLRLFPLLYVVLILIALSVPFMASAVDRSHYTNSIAWCAVYAGDFFGLVGHFHELAPATGHLWSLAVEEQFYLIWPALLLWLVRRRMAAERALWFIVGLALAAILIRIGLLVIGKTVWTLPSTHADALLAGCGLALTRRHGRLAGFRYQSTLVVVAAGALALGVVAPLIRPTIGLGAGYIFIALTGLVLVMVALDGPVKAFLESRPLVYCGRISYGLYLIHVVMLVAFDAELSGPHWIRVAAAVVASFVLAAASRRWFEGYFLGLKRRFEAPA